MTGNAKGRVLVWTLIFAALLAAAALLGCGPEVDVTREEIAAAPALATCRTCVPPPGDFCSQLVALRYQFEATINPPLAPYETVVGRFWVDGAMTFSYYPPLAAGGAVYTGFLRPYERYPTGGCGLLDRAGYGASRSNRTVAPVAALAVWDAYGVRQTPPTYVDGDARYFDIRAVY